MAYGVWGYPFCSVFVAAPFYGAFFQVVIPSEARNLLLSSLSSPSRIKPVPGHDPDRHSINTLDSRFREKAARERLAGFLDVSHEGAFSPLPTPV